MTELNKWIVIEAGHDEDEADITIDTLGIYDTKEDAKKALINYLNEWHNYNPDDDDDNISWDGDTKVTITSGNYCDDWCKVFQINEI